VLMAFTCDLVGRAWRPFPQQWIGIFSQDPLVLQVGAEYLHTSRPVRIFWARYVLSAWTGDRRMAASVLAALLRAHPRCFLSFLSEAMWWSGYEAELHGNVVAVELGMSLSACFACHP